MNLKALDAWWLEALMNNEVGSPLGGVCPRIYSPVGVARAVGSNRLNQGPRWLLKASGGSFRKGAPNPRGGRRPAFGWGQPAHLVAAGPPLVSGVFQSIPKPSHAVSRGGYVSVFDLH